MNGWVIVEQDEGLMVETTFGGDIEVFTIDYDECKNGDSDYCLEKIEECKDSSLPLLHKDRIIKIIEGYL